MNFFGGNWNKKWKKRILRCGVEDVCLLKKCVDISSPNRIWYLLDQW